MENSESELRPENKVIRRQLNRGLRLSYKRLVTSTAKDNGFLVLAVNGKIKRVKASTIKV